MLTIDLLREFTDSIGLKLFAVRDEHDEIAKDSTAIVGYNSEEEIRLSLEYLNNLIGVMPKRQLFRRSMDGQALIVVENFELEAAKTKKSREGNSEISFHIGDLLYTRGIILKLNLEK